MKIDTMDIFRDLQKVFTLSGIDLTKVYIAGGSLLNPESPNDVDIYCEDSATIEKVEIALSVISHTKHVSDLASTFRSNDYNCPIQLIKILQGKPEDVIKQFDFVQNSNFLRFSDKSPFYTDRSSNLKLCENIKTPNTMLFRLVKMLGKGYRIKNGELKKLLKAVEDQFKDLPDEWNLSKKDLGSSYEVK